MSLIIEKTKCRFLIIMLILSSVLMVFLNFYIAYGAIQYLKKPDLGMGLIVIVFSVFGAYMFAIPATVFTILSVKWVRNDKKNKFIVPVFLGIAGTLAGFILSNSFDYWMFIVAFSMLLLFSFFMCDRESRPILNVDRTKPRPVAENTINSTFKKVKAIQIAGLILMLPVAAGVYISPDIQMLIKVGILLVLGLHVWVTIAFLKKNRLALKAKQIESFVFLGITVLTFLAFLINNGISFSSDSLAILFFFILLIALIVYLILSYKRLKQSSLFKFQSDTGPVVSPNDSDL